MAEERNDPNKLIEKDGVLGFERQGGFESVTNFSAQVNGYVADCGNVIGYIMDLIIQVTDPLSPPGSSSSKRFFLTNSVLGQQSYIISALNNKAVWISQSKEPFLPQYFYGLCKKYLNEPSPKRFLPVKIIGKQPDHDVWVFNTNVQLDIHGHMIPADERLHVFIEDKHLQEIDAISADIDDGQAFSDLLDAEKELFGNNFPQVVMVHAASALAANYSLVVNEFGGCAIPVIIGQPVAGKSTALRAVLSVFGIFGFINDSTRKYLEGMQAKSTIPFGWDDVSNMKLLGDIAVSSFNQGGSASMRGRSLPQTVPIVTTNVDTSQLKLKSRWFRIPFETPEPLLKGKNLECKERKLRQAMKNAHKSISLLTCKMHGAIKCRFDDEDYKGYLDEEQIDERAKRMFSLMLFACKKILDFVGKSAEFENVLDQFNAVILPGYIGKTDLLLQNEVQSKSMEAALHDVLLTSILRESKEKVLIFFENDLKPNKCNCGHVVSFHVGKMTKFLHEVNSDVFGKTLTESSIRNFVRSKKIGCVGKQVKFRGQQTQTSAAHIVRSWFPGSDLEAVDEYLGMRKKPLAMKSTKSAETEEPPPDDDNDVVLVHGGIHLQKTIDSFLSTTAESGELRPENDGLHASDQSDAPAGTSRHKEQTVIDDEDDNDDDQGPHASYKSDAAARNSGTSCQIEQLVIDDQDDNDQGPHASYKSDAAARNSGTSCQIEQPVIDDQDDNDQGPHASYKSDAAARNSGTSCQIEQPVIDDQDDNDQGPHASYKSDAAARNSGTSCQIKQPVIDDQDDNYDDDDQEANQRHKLHQPQAKKRRLISREDSLIDALHPGNVTGPRHREKNKR